MQPLSESDPSRFRDVRFVLTDMDETLTHRGRLAAATYAALERLQSAGVTVMPVTAAPAGWCDQMARMWPVDGVIGENGGLFFQRDGHGLRKRYWHDDEERGAVARKLTTLARDIPRAMTDARVADDQPFRLTSVAFERPETAAIANALVSALAKAGADATVNNLWVLGWFGGYDKLAMARRVLRETYGMDDDAARAAVLYVGDSVNDASMFGFFRHTAGVSTIVHDLAQIPVHPAWITAGPGGAGFVEVADAIIAAREGR